MTRHDDLMGPEADLDDSERRSARYSPIEAVIFDLDGLLIDSEPSWRAVGARQRRLLGHAARGLRVEPTTGLRVDEVVAAWRRQYDWGEPEDSAVVEEILAGVIAAIEHDVSLLPGARESVEYFREKNVPLGLASSSPTAVVEAALGHFGLTGAFSVVCSAEHLPFGKPHPQVLLDAAAGLGVAPTSCLVLEDSINGLIAAKAARMAAVVVPAEIDSGDERLVLADLVLSSLLEIDDSHLEPLLRGEAART